MEPHSTILDEVLSKEELRRYGRHLIMPEVGLQGQKRLKASSVLVVGAGGLGSPLLLYLSAAGVGRLGIVDFDVVQLSNLQRQVIHTTEDLGRSKLQSAKRRILEMNPSLQVETIDKKLSSENALGILKDYDVIVDGTDNFPTRYLINDACVLLKKPNIYGSIFRFEGQSSVFDAQRGPCYRCLYPEPPPPGLVPSCAEGGVLGVLPGIVGAIQAAETLKILLGIGNSLVGRLLLLDALKMEFRELKLRKFPECPLCGEKPSIRELIDYEDFCGYGPHYEHEVHEFEISPLELKRLLDEGTEILLLDVREPHEHEIVDLGGKMIPLGELSARVNELNTSQEIVAYCHYGQRSARAVTFLRELGFKKVRNLSGGIDLWAEQIDEGMIRY